MTIKREVVEAAGLLDGPDWHADLQATDETPRPGPWLDHDEGQIRGAHSPRGQHPPAT